MNKVKIGTALGMLQKNKTVKERAEKYVGRIKKSLDISKIQSLEEKIERLYDKIFDLENFSLETNLNKGMEQLTKEDCEKRFSEIIDLSFEKALLERELEIKKEVFISLFGE